MVCLAAVALTTSGAHGQSPGEPAVIASPERIRVSPVSFERGFAEFRRICMDAEAGGEAFETAVKASDFAYERVPERSASEPLWASLRGKVGYSAEQLEDGRAVSECVMRIFVEHSLSRDALIDAIGDGLAPGRPRRINPVVAHWDFGGGIETGLYYHAPSEDLRYFQLDWRRILPEQAD